MPQLALRSVSLEVDDIGHREYTVEWRVQADSKYDLPLTILRTPGLPYVGSLWQFGNDDDPWAWCRPNASVKMAVSESNEQYWDVTQKFSTKPIWRCMDFPIENPLLEPPKISGSFVREREQASYDRFGNRLFNSAYEPLNGPNVEFDKYSATVRIEFNVLNLDRDIDSYAVNKLNATSWWGLPRRSIKICNIPFSKEHWGVCTFYYRKTYEFEIRLKLVADTPFHTFSPSDTDTLDILGIPYQVVGDWDRDLMDEGSKVLKGRWWPDGHWHDEPINTKGDPPNPADPGHFIRFRDPYGELGRVLLDGGGRPARVPLGTDSMIDEIGNLHIEKYGEVDFADLGIPVEL